MTNDELYKAWAGAIDLAKTRVIRFPRLIFLCGGAVSSDSKDPKSCRDKFYKHIHTTNPDWKDGVLLAESVFEEFEHSSYYADLLSFERDLAELSSLTVIFSESPGSLAELGSFAVLHPIRERLLLVINEYDSHRKSFIWRGPVCWLKSQGMKAEVENRFDPISVYKWQYDDNAECFEEAFQDSDDLQDRIEELLAGDPRTTRVDTGKIGHHLLLVLDLLNVVHLATEEEIRRLFSWLEVEEYDRTRMQQFLSLLISLGMVKRAPYGHNEYFISTEQKPRIKWGFHRDAKIRDVSRWQTEFVNHYKQNDERKFRALRRYLRSSREEDS